MPDGNLPIVAADGFSPDPFDVEFGARIRLRRRELHLSQSALATALGVSFQQVQKYERGANRISASMIQRVSVFTQTPVSWYFGEAAGGPEIGGEITHLLTNTTGQALLRAVAGLPADRLSAVVRVAQALAPTAAGA
jgi:transcriptional regulator with XRE-family HTH domain